MKNSFHVKRDGRTYQMLDPYAGKPMPFSKAKHNYSKEDFDCLEIGQTITFRPMFGNENPVHSVLKRIK